MFMITAQQPITSRTLWHLWSAGIIGTLWSLMGVVSFVLTQMNVEAVMSGFPPQQRAYFESFPLWTDTSWAIGVFAGLIGCVLLLLRKRSAFRALLISAIGTILSSLGGLVLLGGMEVMSETDGLGLSVLPVVVAALLASYAHAMRKKGVLS
jgi:hypothetical protein